MNCVEHGTRIARMETKTGRARRSARAAGCQPTRSAGRGLSALPALSCGCLLNGFVARRAGEISTGHIAGLC